MQLSEFTVSGNVVILEVRSEIRKARFKRICKDMDQVIAAMDNVRLVLVMRRYPSLNSVEDLYYDLRFLRLYDHAIEKVAVVCDRIWHKTWVGIFSLFSGIRMACFGMTEGKEATRWIQTK